MDLSTKNNSVAATVMLQANIDAGKSEEDQPNVSLLVQNAVKGEYVEEEIPVIKKENIETQESHQENKVYSYSLSLSQPPPLLPLLRPTPVSSIMPTPLYSPQFQHHNKLYPPVPPYAYLHHSLSHPLYDLPSFHNVNAQKLSANKRKPFSSSKFVKRTKNVHPEKPRHLSDTNNEIPQEATPDLILEPPSHSGTTQSEDQISTRSDRSTIDCPVCGDTAVAHFHYGGMCCYSCKAFFRRVVNTYKVILTSHYQGEECPVLLISYF